TCPHRRGGASRAAPRRARGSRCWSNARSSTDAARHVAGAVPSSPEGAAPATQPTDPWSRPRHTGGHSMAGRSLKGSKSFDNLKDAFAGESQANRRYLYFARIADIEGFPDVAGLYKDTADAETGHAFGHLDFLKEVGDPATG